MQKINLLILAVFTFLIISCEKKEEVEIHQVEENQMTTTQKLDVKVVNEKDPVCGMNTSEHLSDTIQYNGEIYGFCSETCKNEFAKNPEKFLKK